jgi:hypothetical protein
MALAEGLRTLRFNAPKKRISTEAIVEVYFRK